MFGVNLQYQTGPTEQHNPHVAIYWEWTNERFKDKLIWLSSILFPWWYQYIHITSANTYAGMYEFIKLLLKNWNANKGIAAAVCTWQTNKTVHVSNMKWGSFFNRKHVYVLSRLFL